MAVAPAWYPTGFRRRKGTPSDEAGRSLFGIEGIPEEIDSGSRPCGALQAVDGEDDVVEVVEVPVAAPGDHVMNLNHRPA